MLSINIPLINNSILITGSAGFIGSNLALKLFCPQSPLNIIGIDNMNDYYDVPIKKYHLAEIKKVAAQYP